MARLPQPGGDTGTWGDILNDFLAVEHNADGTLKTSGSLAGKVSKTGAENITGVKTFSDSPIVPSPTTNTQVANKAYVDASVVVSNPVRSMFQSTTNPVTTQMNVEFEVIDDPSPTGSAFFEVDTNDASVINILQNCMADVDVSGRVGSGATDQVYIVYNDDSAGPFYYINSRASAGGSVNLTLMAVPFVAGDTIAVNVRPEGGSVGFSEFMLQLSTR